MSARHRAAPFVYLGVEPRAVEGAAEMQLVDYAIKVLDALKWRWGPAHIEVMQTAVRPARPRWILLGEEKFIHEGLY